MTEPQRSLHPTETWKQCQIAIHPRVIDDYHRNQKREPSTYRQEKNKAGYKSDIPRSAQTSTCSEKIKIRIAESLTPSKPRALPPRGFDHRKRNATGLKGTHKGHRFLYGWPRVAQKTWKLHETNTAQIFRAIFQVSCQS